MRPVALLLESRTQVYQPVTFSCRATELGVCHCATSANQLASLVPETQFCFIHPWKSIRGKEDEKPLLVDRLPIRQQLCAEQATRSWALGLPREIQHCLCTQKAHGLVAEADKHVYIYWVP